jgi:hypothetical protein
MLLSILHKKQHNIYFNFVVAATTPHERFYFTTHKNYLKCVLWCFWHTAIALTGDMLKLFDVVKETVDLYMYSNTNNIKKEEGSWSSNLESVIVVFSCFKIPITITRSNCKLFYIAKFTGGLYVATNKRFLWRTLCYNSSMQIYLFNTETGTLNYMQ